MPEHVMYLYGKNSVAERLRAAPKTIKKIYLQHNFSAEDIVGEIEKKRIHIERVSEKALEKIKRADRLQGIVAEVDNFLYSDFDKLLTKPIKERLSLIFLDSINDPHNLGSVIRILACFGKFGIVIPKHRSCEVTDSAMHVASGGENYVPISIVTNMSASLIKAKESGYWIIGATAEGGEDITKIDIPLPVCLVLGSEGEGIRYGIEKQLDLKVTIPMEGEKLSLNLAMSCAILCHEIRNRTSPKT